MTNILPLPVKKNKFGQRIADLDTNTYYRQIAEEVLEAYETAVQKELAETLIETSNLFSMTDVIFATAEAEELVDVITTCITRINIIDLEYFKRCLFLWKNFSREGTAFRASADNTEKFYQNLLMKFSVAFSGIYDEKGILWDAIGACVNRLEVLGYDENKRQELYQAVNDKNLKRGYFED